MTRLYRLSYLQLRIMEQGETTLLNLQLSWSKSAALKLRKMMCIRLILCFCFDYRSLNHGQLTEEDSRVPKATDKHYSLFAVGDHKLFPPRRPQTGCWKLGLRQYESSNAPKQHSKVEDSIGFTDNDNLPDDASVVSGMTNIATVAKVASVASKAVGKLKRQTSGDSSTKMFQKSSAAEMNTILQAQYATTELPKLTKEQTKNYFGTTGVEQFFTTYRELKSRGEVLLDGYSDLEKLILKPAHKNVMLSAMQELQDLGVLTPRETDAESSVAMQDDDDSTLMSYGEATAYNSYATTPKVFKNSRAVAGGLPLLQEVNSGGGQDNPAEQARKSSAVETMAAVVAAFQSVGSRSNSVDSSTHPPVFPTAPVLTAAEIAQERERLEQVSRERHQEIAQQGGLAALSKRAAGRSSKANSDLFTLMKSTKAPDSSSLPPIHKARSGGAGGGEFSISTDNKTLKTSRPSSAVLATPGTLTPGKQSTLASVKSSQTMALSNAPSRLSSARTMKSVASTSASFSQAANASFDVSAAASSVDFGEIVRTASDDEALYGFVSRDFEDAEEEEEDEASKFHGGQVFHTKPFSGKYHPETVSGLPVGGGEQRNLSLALEVVHSRLDDPSPDDPAMLSSYSVASPRAIFLAGCLQNNIPPVTVALIRKKISSTINLAHMGLGTPIAKVLAPCLSALPYLQLVNLSDNNLDDEGLSVLIRAISRHPTIEILDISQNIIDNGAAEALADFLGDPECRLQCLRMSSANIDDGECANFVDVLMNNRHLKVSSKR